MCPVLASDPLVGPYHLLPATPVWSHVQWGGGAPPVWSHVLWGVPLGTWDGPSSVNWQTENITFPHTLCVGGKKDHCA